VPAIHLIEGPVGAGKSTFAFRLSRERAAPRLVLDDWMARLFRPDRPEQDLWPWYQARKERCLDQIWALTEELLDLDSDVVLELGLVQRAARRSFYERVDAAGRTLHVYLLDAPRDVRRERVRKRNAEQGATFAMVVDDEVFELASDAWEAPDEDECSERGIEFPV
jgi:predicted kinase